MMTDLREEDELWEFLSDDDLVMIANSEEERQQRFLAWKNSLERKGMKVNTKKTEVTVSGSEGHKETNIISQDGERL